MGDSLDYFLNNVAERDESADNISTGEAYAVYKQWCRVQEESSVSRHKFTREVKSHDPEFGYGGGGSTKIRTERESTPVRGYTCFGTSDALPDPVEIVTHETDATAGRVAERPTAVTDTTVGELNQTVEIQAQNLNLTGAGEGDQNQTNISVGSLTVAADENATAESEVGLTVSISEITDESGIPINESIETGGVTVTEVETVQPTETETGTENDGFGVLPAVIALICLSLIARRRL
jgi:hypothetical protein